MKYFLSILLYFVLLGIQQVKAQDRNIAGRVLNSEDGKAVSGVSVIVKGTSLGTTTNNEGEFRLDVPQNSETLVFSFIGLKTQEIPISSVFINVTLSPDYIGISDIVATGYSMRGRNEITGSTFQVNGKMVANVPVTSVDHALQGKVPGMVISTSSGTPGSVQDIRIRGVGSITAENQPLIVIDGVPVINADFSGQPERSSLSALTSLGNYDVESITVLKDASATSAYGARGSNGVIVITTKKGKFGETKFSLNSSVGFQNNASGGWGALNGSQREELILEAVHNTFGVPVEEAYDFLISNGITDKLKVWNETYNRKEGNWDELLQNKNALVQNYDISASGGDAVSSFYASIGYNNTEATVVGVDFQRITTKLNYNRYLSQKVLFSTNISVTNTQQDAIVEQSAYFANPHLTRVFMSPWEQPYLADGVTLNTNLTTAVYNTLYVLENDKMNNNLSRGIANSFIEWEIKKNLKFKTLFAADYNLAASHVYQNRVHGDGKAKGGITFQSVTRNFNWVSQNSFDYKWLIEKHRFNFKALMEYQVNNNDLLSGYGESFPADGLMYIVSAGKNFDASSTFTDWKNLSYLGMVNYNFAEKYIADLTYRREGSSLFAPDSRFGNFWSAGAAWNMSEEFFLSDARFLDMLRIRGSYGLSGSSAIGINKYQSLLSYDTNYADQGAVYPSQIGNPDLTWEKNRNYDIGIDYAFFDGRISGSMAWYNKNTFDLLQLVPLSRTTGHTAMMMNVGSMINRGFEGIIKFDLVRSQDFNVNVALNLATVKNEVTELAKDAMGNEINIEDRVRRVAVGQPVYAWYLRKWAGVNPENGNAQWYINGKDGEVTENYYSAQKEWQGESAIPKITAGLISHVDFKWFYVDLNLYYAGGHKVFEDFSFSTHYTGYYSFFLYNGVDELMERWQEPGDNTNVPKVWFGANDDSRESTWFLFEGDYLRVKDLVFGYNFPKKITNKIGCDGIGVSLRGTNLFTVVKDKGLKYDPEVRADGMTRLTTPPVKSVVFGVNLNF